MEKVSVTLPLLAFRKVYDAALQQSTSDLERDIGLAAEQATGRTLQLSRPAMAVMRDYLQGYVDVIMGPGIDRDPSDYSEIRSCRRAIEKIEAALVQSR